MARRDVLFVSDTEMFAVIFCHRAGAAHSASSARAIDYSRANAARSSMQAALDSTALMLSKDLSRRRLGPDQITAKAQAYSTHSIPIRTPRRSDQRDLHGQYHQGSTIQITDPAMVAADFIQLAGFRPWLQHQFDLGMATCGCAWQWCSTTRIDGRRWQNAGAAGRCEKSLIDQLSALARLPAISNISIIPSPRLNVGPATTIRAGSTSRLGMPPMAPASIRHTRQKSSCVSNNKTWTPKITTPGTAASGTATGP